MNPFLLASMEDVKIAEQSYSTFFSSASLIVSLIVFGIILILSLAVLSDGSGEFAGIVGAIPIALIFVFLFFPGYTRYTLSHTYISADKETIDKLTVKDEGNCIFTVLNEGETYSTLFLRKQEAVTRDSNEVPSLMSTVEKSSKVEIYLEVDGELAKEVKIQPKEKITINAKVIGEIFQDGSVSKLEFKEPIKCHSLLK